MSAAYVCPYCRTPSESTPPTCPHCGAPVDLRTMVSDSRWEQQPPIRDMARIQFASSWCQVSGKIVPVTEMNLASDEGIFFSHHTLLWMGPATRIAPMSMRKGWTRTLAGMPLVMMEATGPGRIGFSLDEPGETIAVPLGLGQAIMVHEHRFLVATRNVDYDAAPAPVWYTTGTGDDVEWHYPIGRYLDFFSAHHEPGLLMLHSPGNVFLRDLPGGSTILVEPGALLYMDATVQCSLHFEYPSGDYGLAKVGLVSQRLGKLWLRCTGPGRIAVQSVFEQPEPALTPTRSSGHTTQWG